MKVLDTRRYMRILLYVLIFIKLCVILFAWMRRTDRAESLQYTPSSQTEQTTSGMSTVTDTNSPYYGLPVDAPLHPIQLVHVNRETSDFIRYSKAELPPREEAFLQTILNAQQEMNRKYAEENKRLESDPHHAHKINWFLYKSQTRLNAFVIQEIHAYLKKYYPEGAPFASWTSILISDIKNLRIDKIGPYLVKEFEPEDSEREGPAPDK